MTQGEALDVLKLGKNVFLTGAPGAGKTYVLNQYIGFLRSHNIDAAITAYTGIAASHINGRTLHSWAGLGATIKSLEIERKKIRANKLLVGRIEDAKVLIIDEVSMLHPEELDRVDFVCKTARKSIKPFGGLQLICCGDFFQIPPVNQLGDRFVIDCASWKTAEMKVCYIHEQHRQGDSNLLTILEEMREGKLSENSYALLKSRVGAKVKSPIGLARLYTHLQNVDELNNEELRKLPGTDMVYEIHEHGPEKLIQKLKRDYRVDKLLLKKGARVMFTRNNMGMGYVNGTLGEIVDFNEDGDPIVKTFANRKITAVREQWNLEEDDRIIAWVRQIPLKLAWAITVHKSQGMTLDAAEIDLSRAFDKGMGYVALSRVRKLENISLLNDLNKTALEVNDRIQKIDSLFLANSEEVEAYLHKLEPKELKRLQDKFLSSIGDKEPEDPSDIHYEEDEIPAIDFEVYSDVSEDTPF